MRSWFVFGWRGGADVENLALWKRALAEFSAVFLLASIGLMTVATAITTGAYGLFELSIAFGFAITVMVVVSGAVSGAHFNPAITIMLASFRRFPWRDVPVYIAAQISAGWSAPWSCTSSSAGRSGPSRPPRTSPAASPTAA
jgi:glycerol uptake facilitator-like aquaporin